MVTPDTDKSATTDIVAGRPAVFFDGSCPLCTAEISTYRKCRGADEIDWVDVADGGTGARDETIVPGLVRTDAMRRFHMRRADGGIVSGATTCKGIQGYMYGIATTIAKYINTCSANDARAQVESAQERSIAVLQGEARDVRRGNTICTHSPV